MIASHGRARRTGPARPLAALAASGLLVVSGAGTARACHITHHARPQPHAEAAELPTGTAAARPVALTPTSYLPPVTPPAVLTPRPTAVAAPVVPAAQQLPSAPPTPTVESWDTDHPTGCTPTPPPPRAGAMPPQHGLVKPPAPLSLPAALQVLPTPEPSTIVSALALAGAFAWGRRRQARPR